MEVSDDIDVELDDSWLADEYADTPDDDAGGAGNANTGTGLGGSSMPDSDSRRGKNLAGGGDAARGKPAAQKKADDLYSKLINMGFTDEQARVAVEEVASEQPARSEHGEIAVAEAQRTEAVRVNDVLSVAVIR